MCGICGKVSFRHLTTTHSVAEMCDELIHRGPDSGGVRQIGPTILGHRRLAIIDLSDAATQPLSNKDETIWVVFNGEIYNFESLRNALQRKGYVFRTRSDTEVLVHLYEEEGEKCVDKIKGMFSFAIWDVRKNILFAARDRLGKKPFYYTKTEKSFLFASKIDSLLCDRDVSVEPDYYALDKYLSLQYVPSPLTAFKNIYKLGPGHTLKADLNGNIEIKQFWSPPEYSPIDASCSEVKELIVDQLRSAVKSRMISDVPLGALLSGGIDSTSIVSLMAMESSRPIKTFSIGFEEEDYNELPLARLISERYGTEHHEDIVKPCAVDILPFLIRQYNEPFADPSAIPTYYVSKMARENVTVAISGDGGDESFSGYQHYAQAMRWKFVDRMPPKLQKILKIAVSSSMPYFPYNKNLGKVDLISRILSSDLSQRYSLLNSMWKPYDKKFAYTSDFYRKIELSRRHEVESNAYNGTEPWHWLMQHDMKNYLPDCLMVKSDVASMSNSLEIRSPYLDHQFIEFAATIPIEMKRRDGKGKVILKDAFSKYLPQEILNKPKTGFGIPLGKWIRTDFREIVHAHLLDDVARRRNLFNQGVLREMIDQHTSGRADWGKRIWGILVMEMWFREYID